MSSRMFGKYVLERELAEGGMARVFSATLRGTDGFEKPLVVKVIKDEFSYDPEFVKRFVAEAKTTVALTHPNIVAVYELGSEGGTYFLAMEHVHGISARELLSSAGRLTPAEGAFLGAEVCRALDYAHRKMNVVHRDITPGNVMIDEEGQVKLIDFGIAATSHLSGQTVLGTPGHMPPEQFTSSSIGPEADLFAVGALLLELWSGRAPFRRESAEASRSALSEPAPKPSEIDPALAPLDDIVSRAMRLDPKERPGAAEELGRPLRAFTSGIDSADLSRALAEKVRAARAQKRPAEGATDAAPITRSSEGTKTFATRRELSDIEPPGTRKIPSLAPPAPSPESAPREREGQNVRRRPLWVALTIGLALVGIATARFRGAHSDHYVPPPASAPTAAPSTTVDIEMPRVDPVPLPEPKLRTSMPPTGQGAPLASPPVSAPANEGRASLTLMGDPGTRATVDGIAKGLCPVKLTVAPGPHEIRFTFDATGESRGERITAKPNERLSIFADFAAATPRIRTERD